MCLSKTLQLSTCIGIGADQLWQDGVEEVLGWATKHKCTTSIVTSFFTRSAGGIGVGSCTWKDTKEILRGMASIVVEPVTGAIACAGSKRAAALCAITIYSLTTPYPTQHDNELRSALVKGMVQECIDRPEYCIGSFVGGPAGAGTKIVLGRAANSLAIAATVIRTNRAAAAAERAAGNTAEAATIERRISNIETLAIEDLTQSARQAQNIPVVTIPGPAVPVPFFYLIETTPGIYTSPKGLVYGTGGNDGHVFTHVMMHARPDPNRPLHTVSKGLSGHIRG